MRIIAIQFKNIHSLKGEFELRFDTEPLSSAGIFAIVGATGSGKSTLLDIITLALYNKIPRLSDKISTSSISTFGSIVTHHTRNAFAQVTYQANGNTYISRWEIQKNRNNKFNDYHMVLQDEDGTYHDLKKSEVPKRNAEIIGLEYEQFLKSIVLAQGEFAQFLRANKDQRTKLLEKITGSEIYRKIGERANEKFKATKREYEKIQQIIQATSLLSPEEIQEINEQQLLLKKENNSITKEISSVSNALQIKESIEKLQKEIREFEAQKASIDRKEELLNGEQQKLKTHKLVTPHQVAIHDLASKTKEHKHAIEKKRDISGAIEKNKENKRNLLKQAGRLTNQSLQENELTKTLKQFENQVTQLDQELATITAQGKQLKEIQKHFRDKNKDFRADDIDKQLDHNRKLIKTSGIQIQRPKREIREEIARVRETNEQLRIQREILEKQIETQKKKQEIEHLLQELDEREKRVSKEKEEIDRELKDKEKILDLLRKNLQNQRLIANLQEHREYLEDGEPCPLCGSTEHPFAAHLPDENKNELQQEIDSATLETQKLETTYQNKLAAHSSVKTSIEEKKKQVNTIQESAAQLEQMIETKNIVMSLNQVILREKETKENENQLEKGLHALEQIELLEEYAGREQEIEILRDQLIKLRKKRSGIYAGNSLEQDIQTILNQFEQIQTEFIRLNEQELTTTKQLGQLADQISKQEKELDKIGRQLGFANINLMQDQLLSPTQVATIEEEIRNFEQEKTTWKTKLVETKKDLEELNPEEHQTPINALKADLQQWNEKRSKNQILLGRNQQKLQSQEENEARLNDVREREIQLKKEFELLQIMNQLIGGPKGKEFALYAQGLTLKTLVQYCNRRLNQFNQRYQLTHAHHQLNVIDRYQGNTQRAVATLSGGETFIVSISMALALADLSASGVVLDSLFIDEGFGTLDQDTLETALTILEQIQSESDRKIGIISHVNALRDRISVQIQLDKKSSGYSDIRITES